MLKWFKAGCKGLDSEMLVLPSLLGDARQSPFTSRGLCLHAYKPVNFTEVMQCLKVREFAYQMLWDPLLDGSVGSGADLVCLSLPVQKGR